MPEPAPAAGTTLNQRWAATIAGVLAARGVRHAVVCPGSRSSPLALAFADRPDVRTWTVLDERSAAFFALGLAKGSAAPAAFVCTSGSAGAHALPAVMEASEAGVPLVVLTADRPWELHGFGAPQATEQRALFAGFTRASEAVAEPAELPDCLEHLAATVARCVGRAETPSRGPVHLNVPFREPLVHPDGGPGPCLAPAAARFVAQPAIPDVDGWAARLWQAERPLVVCGPRERGDDFGAAVHALADAFGAPIVADAGSNARFGYAHAVAHADLLLRHERSASALRPDVVLRFGGAPASKVLQAWLDGAAAPTLAVADDGLWIDARHRASELWHAPASAVCAAFVRWAERAPPRRAPPPSYRDTFLAADAAAEGALAAEASARGGRLTEGDVARSVARTLPAGASLFLSSSMPIRDADAFAAAARPPLRVFCNRGLNGIDGVVSTALGVAAATGRPLALLVGDVAALHDLSGFALARRLGVSFTVVLVNNDGGGIFSFLPVADRTEHFERLFGTPHGTDFAHVAALAGATLHRALDAAALERSLAVALTGSVHLVEVRTRRRDNVDAHRAAQRAVVQALEARA